MNPPVDSDIFPTNSVEFFRIVVKTYTVDTGANTSGTRAEVIEVLAAVPILQKDGAIVITTMLLNPMTYSTKELEVVPPLAVLLNTSVKYPETSVGMEADSVLY